MIIIVNNSPKKDNSVYEVETEVFGGMVVCVVFLVRINICLKSAF